MKNIKPKHYKVGMTLVLLMITSIILGKHDYELLRNGNKTDFSYSGPVIRDGGTRNFTGFGYSATVFNRIVEVKRDENFEKNFIKIKTYKLGTKLTFWFPFPFINEEHTYLKESKDMISRIELK